MGTTVLDPGASPSPLHLYAHCLRGHPGGVTLLAINLSRTASESLTLTSRAERYTLSSPQLDATTVQLNGDLLALGVGDVVPNLRGIPVAAGPVSLAPATITFFALAEANNANCR